MNCIIIEDEFYAVKHLENQLKLTGEEINIIKRIATVNEAVEWLQQNTADLIFLDVQLEDGLSFEIFDHVQIKTPVIFTTSYNQYLTKAFDVNSVSYLLKPIELTELKNAIQKFNYLYSPDPDLLLSHKLIPLHKDYQKRFLMNKGNRLHAISQDEVAWFYLSNKRYLFIVGKDNEHYLYNSNLEVMEQRLDPHHFFRINRNAIINFSAIKEMHTLNRQIAIITEPASKEELVVSVSRTSSFKQWLDR
jgi:two-component system response regulator LytT